MEVMQMFGRNGFRLELFKSGGYSEHRFGGDIRGWSGDFVGMVGFKISDRERERLVKTHIEAGTLVCSTWIPSA